MITFLEMYKNIAKKFGKDSEEMRKFKDYYMRYQDKPHVVRRIYLNMMGKLWATSSLRLLDVERLRTVIDKSDKVWYNIDNEREVINMLIIAVISFFSGLFMIDYNQNNETKYNILIGVLGYILTLIIPLFIIGYKFF